MSMLCTRLNISFSFQEVELTKNIVLTERNKLVFIKTSFWYKAHFSHLTLISFYSKMQLFLIAGYCDRYLEY